MAKTAMIMARTGPDLKTDAERILRKLGLSTTDAINLFLSQIRLHKGLPFEVKIPNKKTQETFKKTDASKEIVKCKDADDMFERLKI